MEIKFGFRHNLIYLLMLIIFNFCRKVDLIVMDRLLKFETSLLVTLLMFVGEFIGGLILSCYQNSFLNKKENDYFMGIKLIKGPSDISHPDNIFKIFLLLLMASFFDFLEFIMTTYYIPKFNGISKTLEMRTSSILIISSALFFYFLLKLEIFKHQKFSLFIILICLIIIIIIEYFYQIYHQDKNLKEFGFILLLIFLIHFFNSLLDSIEKYLLEYDFLNPFKTLMIEGLFGTIFTSIYSIIVNPFQEIYQYYKEKDKQSFIILIICLGLYIFLSGGRNAYRVATNKIYSPMTKSLTDYILNPLFIVYYFIFENDFCIKEEKKIIFFILNVFLSIIIVISGLIYNELLILVCYGLDRDTHREVSERASNHCELFNYEVKENENDLIGEESDDDKSDKSDDS